MHVQLVPIPEADLPALARGLIPPRLTRIAVAGGLPPSAVAERIRQRLAAGKPGFWVGMFYIFAEDGACVGAAGFKDVPRAREVEVGYGIAPARRGRGYAGAAVQALLRMAAETGEVDTLVLQIASANIPSTKLAQRAGFSSCGPIIDDDGDETVRWQRAVK